MADEDAAKAEKLAAAKKRVEQMKKQKQKKAGAKKEGKEEAAPELSQAVDKPDSVPDNNKDSAEELKDDTKDKEDTVPEPDSGLPQRQPSLSLQSKMRSSSFRQSTGGPLSPGYGFSPEGDTAPDIHRKQAARIEELERENKRLAKEVIDGERRWKKAEEELEDIREADDDDTKKSAGATPNPISSGEVEKLNAEIAALQRQNTQLQAQSSRMSRHGSSPSVATTVPADLEAVLQSKSSTIESMEIEISNLRAQLERIASSSSEKEQIAALEAKLLRSERSAETAQRELGDLKKNLERTTEKVVKEGSERISAETKLRTLEREAEESKVRSEELQLKVDALEKKVSTLATLHKEHDARSQTQKKEREKAEKEASELRAKMAGIENENLRLKEERERARKRDAQGIDDEGVEELENEERQRLEKKVRDLEGEVHELRRGVWRERRKELDGEELSGLTSPGMKFTDVDLGGGMSPNRRRSLAPGGKGGLGDFLTSGFNAITGANANANADDGLLLEDDEELDFDEDAFRLAQEADAAKRIERVKGIKRGLKDWEGWRLDLVENRRGGGDGVGEIFEV
ncbi:related to USO1-intracellular protein transport protein [Rhynchosporium secalis]|uniref:Related to USO1-intracellular protein transport protein n=1 Tax=Rhynchosporium secalis TaxID=38038 RepID=A0A1E1M591_RHYSE|nr:related to USO1-intracellular protein transport protein [Rhynchosporium secalis]